jgi:hypothetical protein
MPYFIHGGCSVPTSPRMREKVIPRAQGLVVAIGFGSGPSLPCYDPDRHVIRAVAPRAPTSD